MILIFTISRNIIFAKIKRVKFKVLQSKSLLCVGSVINPVLDLDVTLAYMVYSCLVPVYSCIFLYVFQLLFLNIRESEVIPSTDQAPFSDVSSRFEFLNFIENGPFYARIISFMTFDGTYVRVNHKFWIMKQQEWSYIVDIEVILTANNALNI